MDIEDDGEGTEDENDEKMLPAAKVHMLTTKLSEIKADHNLMIEIPPVKTAKDVLHLIAKFEEDIAEQHVNLHKRIRH
jgi:hypothetical protein